MDEIIFASSSTEIANEHVVPEVFGRDESSGHSKSTADSGHIHSTTQIDNCIIDEDECSCLVNEAPAVSDDRCSPNQNEADIKQIPLRSVAGTSKSRYSPVQKGSSKSICREMRTNNLEVAVDMTTSSQTKVSPRILRSPIRKKSPIRWFPRKKTESYLERKIRMLQEKEGGKIASLDETLGAANPHLCRIEREKLAAQAAAEEAMDSRKNALIEASWCRILKLAGIPCNSAILDLQKAERKASEALSEAERVGVILQNGPDREITTGAVTACFDTAFEVDKEVASVIKAVLHHVSQSCSAGSQENPIEQNIMDISGIDFEASSSEAESQSDRELERGSCSESTLRDNLRPKKRKPKSPIHKSLINLMLKRIIDLSPDYRASLASIVATRGLSALLKLQSLEQESIEDAVDNTQADAENSALSGLGSIIVEDVTQLLGDSDTCKSAVQPFPTPDTSKRPASRKHKETHVQSLDQILVKHVSRLEKEKLAAQASLQKKYSSTGNLDPESEYFSARELDGRKGNSETFQNERRMLCEVTNIQTTEEAMETNCGSGNRKVIHKITTEDVPDLGSILVKHVSRLEKEKGAALSKCDAQDKIRHVDRPEKSVNGDFPASHLVRDESNRVRGTNSEAIPDLSSILVKHVSRLEKEKLAALRRDDNTTASRNPCTEPELHTEKDSVLNVTVAGSSEKDILQRDLSNSKGENTDSQVNTKIEAMNQENKIAVKTDDNISRRKTAREKQMEEEWGGLSLGNALKRHVSKLELEQAAWRQAEEEARRRPNFQ